MTGRWFFLPHLPHLLLGLLLCAGCQEERARSGYLQPEPDTGRPDAAVDLGPGTVDSGPAHPDPADTGRADGTQPPEDLATPPGDLTAPPADLAGPPEDLTTPPEDLAAADLTPADLAGPDQGAPSPADLTVADVLLTDTAVFVDQGGDPDLGPPPPPLLGTWANLQVHSALAEVPILGDLRNETRAMQLVTIEQQGDALLLRSRTCAIEIVGESDLVRTVIPDRFIAALAEGQRGLTWDGQRLRVERGLELRGVNLANPATDPLPTTAADPRVTDQDADGHPGLTVRVTGLVDGEIYVIQRAWDELDGRLDPASDQLVGRVTWGDEQVILGSDNPLLANGAPSRPDPDPDHSHFQMRRLAGAWDCPRIAAEAEALFPGWRGPLAD